ncbi:MAG: DUF6166 domain-containing protein [Cytophagales bacterium]|nr:DUF6166 domain-containing protein [Cytophagales bacterium]
MKSQIEQYSNLPIQLKGDIETGRVWLFDKELLPNESLKHKNHSPNGFAWRYGGSGPAQLALAICLELFDIETALEVYQDFKWKYIAVIHQSDFEIDFTLEHFKPEVRN